MMMPVTQAPRSRTGWSIGVGDADRLDELLGRMEGGLETTSAEHLRELLDLPLDKMAVLLGTSARTLSRRQEAGRLTPEESDRLYRYARLFERAVEVLGDANSARHWLKEKQWTLGGRVPLEVARYEPGAREVEDLLGRIEHGLPV